VNELARVEVENDDERCLLRVHGEIDISNAGELAKSIENAVPNSAAVVIIDLTHTTYLDSAGVQLLFRLADRLGDRRQRLRLVVPKEAAIRTVLELTGIARLIPMVERVAEAEPEK